MSQNQSLYGQYVTAQFNGNDTRQGWVVGENPLVIRGWHGDLYVCEGEPTPVINPPERKPEILFRVQDKDGRGPFKPGLSEQWIVPRMDHNNLVPFFQEFAGVVHMINEGGHPDVDENSRIVSACTTLPQLRRWFTREEMKTLYRLGYQCVHIVGYVIAQSDTQVMAVIDERFKPKVVPMHGMAARRQSSKKRLKKKLAL